MRIVAIEHVTLDGVMQAPGRADEDTRGGFEHGGWAFAGDRATDPDIGAAMSAPMANSDGLLLGRRTYDDLLQSWNDKGGPFKNALNNATKYVVSTTYTDPLPWPNSTIIGTNLVEEVGELRRRPGGEVHILGSGQLLATLFANELVDELLLVIHPMTLGTGRSLFPDGMHAAFDLVDARPSATGTIIATYRSRST